MTWKIFFIMWVSWAWKWTLIKNLKNLNNDRFYFPLSYKSRQIRETETNWVDACFVSQEEFENDIRNNEFIEYAKVYGLNSYYWTKYKDIIENWINKWKLVVKEIDMEWLLILKNTKIELAWLYKTIFLTVPFEIQTDRIKARWVFMSNEELEKRKITAIEELEEAKKYCDYIIDTSDKTKDEVLNQVFGIINK